MATIEKFEDIEAWQKARILCRDIYSASYGSRFFRDRALKDQIRSASISVMDNIAEGFEREGNGEFRQFLAIAKGSAGEVRSQLYVALDQHYIDEATFSTLKANAEEISRMLTGLIRYLEKTDIRGRKYR